MTTLEEIMMTTARSQQIYTDVTPYYHCVSRCVRRSFLCGSDQLTGKSYEHRKEWVEQRILTLASIYCIDISAYAVMSNHYHLVAFINKETALSLSANEIIERWCREHQMPPLIQQFVAGNFMSNAEINACNRLIETWRARLYSISWFMKELNYAIAVQANKEDQCTGRFWEGRFKSQALLSDKALLCAMAYVDLNPIRSKMAKTPEQSAHTAIKARLISLKNGHTSTQSLQNFRGYEHNDKKQGIPFRLMDYIELIDWVGRQIRDDKPGHIEESQPKILTRLALSQQECLKLCIELEKKPRLWIGSSRQLVHVKTRLNRQRMVGLHIS